jgi:proline iminopeptidase
MLLRKKGKLFFYAILIFCTCSCGQNNEKGPVTVYDYFNNENPGVEAGGVKMIPITTPSGTFNVWIKRFGVNPRIRVLLLHGGPGGTHEYFECMESFLPREGIEFIYYDQLGSGNSDHPADSSLWTTGRFVEEVEQLREALKLNRNDFFLLGHSWGGILAIEYALKYPDHLKGLIISNMMASCPAYDKYAKDVLSGQMDPAVLATLQGIEKKQDFQNPLYMELLMPNFYEQHILRMPHERWPEPVLRFFRHINQDVYTIMQGPSEFGISGRLSGWDRSRDLEKIKVPTLVIGARYDTMDPEYMKWMSAQFPKGKYLYCENGSHMCMYDDQETYMEGLIHFLKENK